MPTLASFLTLIRHAAFRLGFCRPTLLWVVTLLSEAYQAEHLINVAQKTAVNPVCISKREPG